MMRIEKGGSSGVRIPDLGISMDCSGRDGDEILVTHAHGDHIPGNPAEGLIYATPATAALMKKRGGPQTPIEIDFGETFQLDHADATFYPAGHILGSAMIYIETEEANILYTGDCRRPPSPATEGFQLPSAVDVLVTEATFGLPIYRWEPYDVLFEQVRRFARQALDEGATPLFLGYNLGKAQELAHILSPLERTVQFHGAGYKLCSVYEDFGIDLGTYESYDRDTAEGNILIAPSSAYSKQFAGHIKSKRVAYCSGWASLESRRTQLTVDELIPLSDHLDFFELLDICEQLQPQQVYLCHTPDPTVLQHYLKQREIKAEALQVQQRP